MGKIGSVANSISTAFVHLEGLRPNDGSKCCAISDNALRTVAHARLYKKSVIALLAGELHAVVNGDLMLRPERETHPNTAYITDLSKEKIICVMLTSMAGVFWNEWNPTLPTSFVGLKQFYTYRRETTLNASVMVGY